MNYDDKILEQTKQIIETIVEYHYPCSEYVESTISLYGFWKKIVPPDGRIEQLMTFIELRRDLNNATYALQSNTQRNTDAVHALNDQVRKAEQGLSKIDAFQTETQATEALCDYLIQVIDMLTERKKLLTA